MERGFKSFTQHLIDRDLSQYNNFTIYQYSEEFGNCKIYFGGYNQESKTVPFQPILDDENTGDVLWGSRLQSFTLVDAPLSISKRSVFTLEPALNQTFIAIKSEADFLQTI